jgi:hypothetical protein
VAVFASLVFWILAAPIARAHEPGQARWQASVSVTPAYIGAAEIEGGGEYESRVVALRLGTTGPVGPRTRAGLTLAYSYSDNRFATPTAFGAGAPWEDMERIGLSASIQHAASRAWLFSVSPSADYFREKGADLGDALTFGGVVSASRVFEKGRVLGIGAGVFSQLEEARMFVFPVVNWALTDRLRINNPLPAGPTGPAGLELNYSVGETWAVGMGGAYRQVHFRLREDGPFADGVAEETGVIAFVHAGADAGGRLSLDLYVGAVLNGQLEVQDRNGDALVNRDLGTAPIVGAAIRLAF